MAAPSVAGRARETNPRRSGDKAARRTSAPWRRGGRHMGSGSAFIARTISGSREVSGELRRPKAKRSQRLTTGDGAVEKTRTSTGVTPQRPQRCASTSSATTALAGLLAKAPGLDKARSSGSGAPQFDAGFAIGSAKPLLAGRRGRGVLQHRRRGARADVELGDRLLQQARRGSRPVATSGLAPAASASVAERPASRARDRSASASRSRSSGGSRAARRRPPRRARPAPAPRPAPPRRCRCGSRRRGRSARWRSAAPAASPVEATKSCSAGRTSAGYCEARRAS